MATTSVVQRSRWVLTLHNYDVTTDYKQYLMNPTFKIRRAVIGKEVSENNVHHIQGYIEYERSYRLSHCRKVLCAAHWEAASGSSLVNYRYCTKGGTFFTIGDFAKEEAGSCSDGIRNMTVPLLLRGLLHPKTAAQVKVSKDYFERHSCFDKVTVMIKNMEKNSSLFENWKGKKLYLWQYQCLTMIMKQSDRKIMWVTDLEGNKGKSYLAQYLSTLYGFTIIEGSMSSRDAAFFVGDESRGFCIDVSRSSISNFDYSTLESLKNGFLMSGKYAGRVKRFPIMPVIVFSNAYPNYAALSSDRWDVYLLGSSPFLDLSKDAIISPREKFPFIEPCRPPDLSEDFDLREFLEINLPNLMNPATHSTGSIPVIPVGEAGPSTTTDHNHDNQNTMVRVAIDETLPSQSIEVMTEPIPVHHKKPVDCPHKDIEITSKGCNCVRKRSSYTSVENDLIPEDDSRVPMSLARITDEEVQELVSHVQNDEQQESSELMIENLDSENSSMEILRSPIYMARDFLSPIPVIKSPSHSYISQPTTNDNNDSSVTIEEVVDSDSDWETIPKNLPKCIKNTRGQKKKRSSKKFSFSDSPTDIPSQSRIVFDGDGQMSCKKLKK